MFRLKLLWSLDSISSSFVFLTYSSIYLFKRFLLFQLWVWYVHMNASASRGQRCESPLGLGLQAVVNHLMFLGIELRSLGRTVMVTITFNHWTISPAHPVTFFLKIAHEFYILFYSISIISLSSMFKYH